MKDYKFTISAKDKTKAGFKSVKNGLKGIRSGINNTSVQLGVLAGVTGLGAIVTSSINAGSELLKLSSTVNASVKELSQWQYAGEQVGIEGDKMADIFKDVQDKIGDLAVTGGGGAIDMFEKLNLNIQDFVGLSAPEQLTKIGAALDGVATESEKIFFMEALAGDASRLLPLLKNNGEELKKLAQEADDLGISMDRLEAEKLRAAQKAIGDAGKAIEGVGNKIAVKLAPFIVAATKSFTKMSLNATKGTDWITKGIDGVSTVIGVMGDGLHGVGIIFQGIKIAGIGFGAAVVGAIKLIIDGVVFLSNSLKDLILGPIGALIETGNSLGVISDSALQTFKDIDEGLTFETPQVITDAYEGMVTKLGEENGKLHNMMMEPLPSDGVTKVFEEIKAGAVEVGKVIDANVKKKLTGGISADEAKKLQDKLDRIAESNLSQLELLKKKEDEEQAIIKEALDNKLINYQQYLEQKYLSEEKFEKKRKAIKKKTVKNEGETLSQINALSKSFGEKGEKIAQGIALKETITNTHAGAMSAYKALAGIPIIGPALGAVAYATVWAQGIKSQQGIKSRSKGGGSPSVSVPSIPKAIERQPVDLGKSAAQQNNQQTPIVQNTYYIQAQGYQDIQVAEGIRRFVEDGGIIVPANSRQAEELVPE